MRNPKLNILRKLVLVESFHFIRMHHVSGWIGWIQVLEEPEVIQILVAVL